MPQLPLYMRLCRIKIQLCGSAAKEKQKKCILMQPQSSANLGNKLRIILWKIKMKLNSFRFSKIPTSKELGQINGEKFGNNFDKSDLFRWAHLQRPAISENFLMCTDVWGRDTTKSLRYLANYNSHSFYFWWVRVSTLSNNGKKCSAFYAIVIRPLIQIQNFSTNFQVSFPRNFLTNNPEIIMESPKKFTEISQLYCTFNSSKSHKIFSKIQFLQTIF